MDTDNAVQNYINVSKALQKKYAEIRREMISRQQLLSEEFKPIVKPLREISEKFDTRKEQLTTTTRRRRSYRSLS